MNLGSKELSLGQYIRIVRRAFHFTQNELAEKIHINANFLSRIECGDQMPSYDTLIAIANGLGCDVILEFRLKESPIHTEESVPDNSELKQKETTSQ